MSKNSELNDQLTIKKVRLSNNISKVKALSIGYIIKTILRIHSLGNKELGLVLAKSYSNMPSAANF